MKWVVAAGVLCYAVGAWFLWAWEVEEERMFRDPPGGHFDLNPFTWMLKTAVYCFVFGTGLMMTAATLWAGHILRRMKSN